MSTRALVVLDHDGTPRSEVVALPGTLVAFPVGELRREAGRDADRVVLRLRRGTVEGGDGAPPDLAVGSIPVVVDVGRGRLETVIVPLVPPAPLTNDAVDEMWHAVSGLPPTVAFDVRRRAVWPSEAVRVRRGLSTVFGLEAAVALATKVLREWPQHETTDVVWRAIDVPGGRELRLETLRRPHRARPDRVGGRVVPTRTARRVATTYPWRLRAVSVMAEAVVRHLDDGAGLSIQQRRALQTPFRRVAAAARPVRPGPDPPVSGWPAPLRRLFDDMVWLLGAWDAVAAGGDDAAPLCQVWELYEGWVAAEVSEAVTSALGGSPSTALLHDEKPGWVMSWPLGQQGRVELRCQQTFHGGAVDCAGVPIRSVTARLTPDLLLSIDDGSRVAQHVVDAKLRNPKPMTAGQAATAASKYLWGLRGPCDAPALDSIVLVTTAPVQTTRMYDDNQALVDVIRALPGDAADISQIIESLLTDT